MLRCFLFIQILILLLSVGIHSHAVTEGKLFRLHLSVEPTSLDPSLQKGSGAMFLTNALQLPLFLGDLKNPLKPGILKSCKWKNPTELLCQMTENRKWSNGNKITSVDVVRTFSYFQKKKDVLQRTDLIANINIVEAKGEFQVQFKLQNPDPNFQERLSSPLLAPIYSETFPDVSKADSLITSGPYKIQKWETKRKIQLTPNSFFLGHVNRPDVEFTFIQEDTTALMLYQKGQLDFLRRLPSAFMSSYEGKSDFFKVPLVRFDYVGFGPTLDKQQSLRKILSDSLKYDDWKTVLLARGRPGCFGIGTDLLPADPCLEFKSDALVKMKEQLKTMSFPRLELHYSTLGGEDHKRSMEWLQSEWKKNLDLPITVRGLDNALFQKEMNDSPASIFRFGVSLEHLSCLNALENFVKNPNYPLGFKQTLFINRIDELAKAKTLKAKADACEKALQYLIDERWIIPLGRIQIGVLMNPHWQGWTLTPLNYLDLSQLHWEP